MARIASASNTQMRIENVLDEAASGFRPGARPAGVSSPPYDEPPAPWHFLYFRPLPHGHGSLRPGFGPWDMKLSGRTLAFYSSCTFISASSRLRENSVSYQGIALAIPQVRLLAAPLGAEVSMSTFSAAC